MAHALAALIGVAQGATILMWLSVAVFSAPIALGHWLAHR